MKKFKAPVKQQYAEALVKFIKELVVKVDTSETPEMLYVAALNEIKDKLEIKLLKPQTEYTLSLTPVQALAYKMMCDDWLTEVNTYMGNNMLKHSNEIDKIYN